MEKLAENPQNWRGNNMAVYIIIIIIIVVVINTRNAVCFNGIVTATMWRAGLKRPPEKSCNTLNNTVT